MINNKNYHQHYMQVVHNVENIDWSVNYSRLHQCFRILDVYRKLVASILYTLYNTINRTVKCAHKSINQFPDY